MINTCSNNTLTVRNAYLSCKQKPVDIKFSAHERLGSKITDGK